MSRRSFRGDSSSKAAAPLPSASVSSSLTHQASSISIPKITPHLIAELILPFIADRVTWNSVYSANNELRLAGKNMTPPWPNKAFNLGDSAVRHVAFSPSGSQLAFCINTHSTAQYVVRVWDRWGKETLLGGHTKPVHCLEYSLDEEYLASGSEDGSIRIWHTESFHSTSSHPHMERPTQSPRQADVILVGSRYSSRGRGSMPKRRAGRRASALTALSFSRTDSNLLASGGSKGEIKVWDVKEQTCIHAFVPRRSAIRSLHFAGGSVSACIALADDGSVIRFWRAEGSSDFISETIGNADVSFSPVFSPSGSFVATYFIRRTGDGFASTLVLYKLETMTKTQSVVMSDLFATCFAVSPDSKQLVCGGDDGRIRLLQTDDFSIQRDLDATGEGTAVCSVAFDPTCRFLVIGCDVGSLRIRRL